MPKTEQKTEAEPVKVTDETAQAPADPVAEFERDYPDLAGVATQDLVDKIEGQGSFKASYINWSRTMELLRKHAPGWLPELMQAPDGGIIHHSPVGGFLYIRFVNADRKSVV